MEASWNVSRSPLADQRSAAAALLGGDRGGEEIIGLVARRLCVGEAAGGHEFRQRIELLEQSVVELAPALIGRKPLRADRWARSSVSQPTSTARGRSAW